MLAAVRCPRTTLITGAYTAPGLGVCPLLASAPARRTREPPLDLRRPLRSLHRTPTESPREITDGEREALQELLVASLERHAEHRAAVLLADRTRQRVPVASTDVEAFDTGAASPAVGARDPVPAAVV